MSSYEGVLDRSRTGPRGTRPATSLGRKPNCEGGKYRGVGSYSKTLSRLRCSPRTPDQILLREKGNKTFTPTWMCLRRGDSLKGLCRIEGDPLFFTEMWFIMIHYLWFIFYVISYRILVRHIRQFISRGALLGERVVVNVLSGKRSTQIPRWK